MSSDERELREALERTQAELRAEQAAHQETRALETKLLEVSGALETARTQLAESGARERRTQEELVRLRRALSDTVLPTRAPAETYVALASPLRRPWAAWVVLVFWLLSVFAGSLQSYPLLTLTLFGVGALGVVFLARPPINAQDDRVSVDLAQVTLVHRGRWQSMALTSLERVTLRADALDLDDSEGRRLSIPRARFNLEELQRVIGAHLERAREDQPRHAEAREPSTA